MSLNEKGRLRAVFFIQPIYGPIQPLTLAPNHQYLIVMSTGKVKFFNTEKGYGFIIPDQGGKEVFVHKTGVREPLWEGDAVTYELEEGPKGMNAVNVKKVQ